MYKIYSLLNQDAKSWWYNRQLRRQGQIADARKRERESIRSHANVLRNAVYATVGRGGWHIEFHDPRYANSAMSGYGGVDEPIIQAAIQLGIPVCDSTTIPDDDIIEVISYPMIASGEPDEPPYHSLSYAPIEYVFKLYKDLGATIYNLEV